MSPVDPATFRLVAAVFDSDFYLAMYRDVRKSGIDPVVHYLQSGWREGRDPSPTFKTADYLSAHPELRDSGICPLVHYIGTGINSNAPVLLSPEALHRQQVQAAFDLDYYLKRYPDVTAAAIPPLDHYLQYGWREGRNPSGEFDTRYYLESNADVRESGVCPLVHFVAQGASEGRLGRHPSLPAQQAMDTATALANSGKSDPPSAPIGVVEVGALRRCLTSLPTTHPRGIVLSLSHDDYVIACGGVQNCIVDEERASRERGWAHVHVSPAQSFPALRKLVSPEEISRQCQGQWRECRTCNHGRFAGRHPRQKL